MIDATRTNERADSSVTVTMTAEDWSVVLEDLRGGLEWDDLEPETREMIDSLYELGVK